MSGNKLKPEKIQILDFKIIEGRIESPFEFDIEKVTGHNFHVDFETAFNVENKLVKADFKVSVATLSEDKKSLEAKGEFHFVFVFTIENMEELVKINQKDKPPKISVDSSLGNALASISYSTSRGVLMTRFQGTSLDSFILPVINPNDLLK